MYYNTLHCCAGVLALQLKSATLKIRNAFNRSILPYQHLVKVMFDFIAVPCCVLDNITQIKIFNILLSHLSFVKTHLQLEFAGLSVIRDGEGRYSLDTDASPET